MGNYSVPDSIRKFKPKGTMVKVINGSNYYVYEYKTITDANGKRKTKMGKSIGKIVEDKGFIPNDSYIKDGDITTLEYGQYKLVLDNSKNTYELLNRVFAYDDAARIYCMAVICFINGFTPITRMSDYYEQSYLNIEFNAIKMKYTSLSNLLDNLGRRQEKVHEFENMLIKKSSKEIAIDGHVIPNYSNQNDLAEIGNKFNMIGDSQINLLMTYDINTNMPLTSRFYSGSTLDKISVKDLIQRNELHDVLYIVDRGFYSNENIEYFSKDGNKYIIPLSPNLKSYKKAIEELNFASEFVYEKNKKRTIVEFKELKYEEKRICVFRDKTQNTLDRVDYLKNLEAGKKGFSKENFEKVKDFFGMIVLETNIDISAEEVFQYYKKRWKIETFYNFFKNKINFESLNESDYYQMQGLSFIMLITGMIHSEMKDAIKSLKGYSLDDILLKARFIKAHRINGKWITQNVKRELREMFTVLNSPLTTEIDSTYL